MTAKKLLALIFVLAAHAAAPLAHAAEWETYANESSGFTVEYPASLFSTLEPSREGDGIVSTSVDGEIEFRAYAFNNGDELPLDQVREIIVSDLDGREITYQRSKKNWIVVSGYEPGEGGVRDIFYQRLEASPDRSRFSVFEIIYPETERATVDKLIKRIGRSLTPPDDL